MGQSVRRKIQIIVEQSSNITSCKQGSGDTLAQGTFTLAFFFSPLTQMQRWAKLSDTVIMATNSHAMLL